mmetsp:Transcript_29387/g.68647  ORF Transcript_29387/g.68647 Transcript_29387/m.68647 type:complete len:259 (-) Transcript_29387:162-938(-)
MLVGGNTAGATATPPGTRTQEGNVGGSSAAEAGQSPPPDREANPTHEVVGMGYNFTQIYEVHDKLVSTLVKILEETLDTGPAIRADRLFEKLYREHPGAREDVASAGGIMHICEVSKMLMYVEDGGGGKVHLDAVSDVFKITGRVTRVVEYAFFMESSIGNSNVRVPRKILYDGRAIEEGQVATVLATRDQEMGTWRGCWVLSVSSGAPGVQPLGRRMDEGAQDNEGYSAFLHILSQAPSMNSPSCGIVHVCSPFQGA